MFEEIYMNIKCLTSCIKDVVYLDNAIIYIKVAFIQAPIEAALFIFCIECFLIFKDFGVEIGHIIYLVFIPVAVAAVVCIFYTLSISLYFISKVKTCYDSVIMGNSEPLDAIYREVDDYFRPIFFKIHTCGALCYFCATALWSLMFNYIEQLNDLPTSTSCITFIISGLVAGLMWNISGFFSDGRIDWAKVYRKFNNSNIVKKNEELRKRKFKHTYRYYCIQVLILILVITFFFVMIFIMSPEYYKDGVNLTDLNVLSFSFFITAIVFSITRYIKIIYSLHVKHEFDKNTKKDPEERPALFIRIIDLF